VVCLEIVIYYVYAHLLAIGKSVNDGAEGFGSASVAPDYSTQVIWVHVNLKQVASRGRSCGYGSVFRIVDDSLNQVFERSGQHN
jgi:hypothetical protein